MAESISFHIGHCHETLCIKISLCITSVMWMAADGRFLYLNCWVPVFSLFMSQKINLYKCKFPHNRENGSSLFIALKEKRIVPFMIVKIIQISKHIYQCGQIRYIIYFEVILHLAWNILPASRIYKSIYNS